MGTSWYCPNAVKMDKVTNGIYQCRVDGQICLKQQYCPSKRKYERTVGAKSCSKYREREQEEDGRGVTERDLP